MIKKKKKTKLKMQMYANDFESSTYMDRWMNGN